MARPFWQVLGAIIPAAVSVFSSKNKRKETEAAAGALKSESQAVIKAAQVKQQIATLEAQTTQAAIKAQERTISAQIRLKEKGTAAGLEVFTGTRGLLITFAPVIALTLVGLMFIRLAGRR